MCCKEPAIVELQKPAGEWCVNCDKGAGCKIYEDRPAACKSFECLWLHSQKPHIDPKLRFPEDMRPDKSKVILNKKEDGQLFVHVPKDRPDAWKKGKIGRWLERENMTRRVAIIPVGGEPFLM